MRVTLDSNAWEQIFDPTDRRFASLRLAFRSRYLAGFICETGFKIEAIRKRERSAYFAQPAMGVQFPFDVVMIDGVPHVRFMSIGPEDERHPGLPEAQSGKLRTALDAGVKLLRGAAWMGLPVPAEIQDASLFISGEEACLDREQRQIEVLALIEARGVGKAAFDAAGGWQGAKGAPPAEKRLQKACAEWADSEMVAAHIAYQNDILCTSDRGRSAGASILNQANRSWLEAQFGVRFSTPEELCSVLPR